MAKQKLITKTGKKTLTPLEAYKKKMRNKEKLKKQHKNPFASEDAGKKKDHAKKDNAQKPLHPNPNSVAKDNDRIINIPQKMVHHNGIPETNHLNAIKSQYNDPVLEAQWQKHPNTFEKGNAAHSHTSKSVDPFMMVTMQEGYDPTKKKQASAQGTNAIQMAPQMYKQNTQMMYQQAPSQPAQIYSSAVISRESTVTRKSLNTEKEKASLIPTVLKLKKQAAPVQEPKSYNANLSLPKATNSVGISNVTNVPMPTGLLGSKLVKPEQDDLDSFFKEIRKLESKP